MHRRWLIAILAALLVLGGSAAVVVTAETAPPQPGKPPAGKAEMVDAHSAADGTIRAWPNTGGFPAWPWGDPVSMVLGHNDPVLTRFADLDGDGFDELISINPDGTTSAWWNNHTFPDHPWHASVMIGKGWVGDLVRIQFADLTGDDRPERRPGRVGSGTAIHPQKTAMRSELDGIRRC
ncbi:FG-GAP repeat domain-containing protein [Saccharothrix deserti]|uniref:FG-GAP repeat domain-containing protein n=1 Tax=Saccharothrix deserti TaxID=2593674 RepID=UPI00131E2278|nr:VCBS repeat-containing protein [Saccharothrix deserti]